MVNYQLEVCKKCNNTKYDCHIYNTPRTTPICPDKYVTPKQLMPIYVAKYKTPSSDIDNLLIKHQIEAEHQIDMDKMCQCHHNKQDHNMSTRATRVSK